MNKSLGTFMAAIPFALSFASVAEAQPQAQADKIPVKLQFVISTFEGDRKVSSVPYTMLATANGGQVSLLNGTNVPLQISGDGKVTYTNIGTNISCTVTTEAGNFRIDIRFDEKSVTPARTPASPAGTAPKPPESPSFRDVNYNGIITVKDGESKQLISAPDKGTGEVIKVDITLTLETPRRASVELDTKDARAAIAIPISLN
jgi:hypothetical protein